MADIPFTQTQGFNGLLSAGGGILGSVIGGLMSRDTMREANEANYQMAKEFAQNSIKWKVNDARNAGIHPLAALGVNASYAPSAMASSSDYTNLGANVGSKLGQATADALAQLSIAKAEAEVRKTNAEANAIEGQATSIPAPALDTSSYSPELNANKQYLNSTGGAKQYPSKDTLEVLEDSIFGMPYKADIAISGLTKNPTEAIRNFKSSGGALAHTSDVIQSRSVTGVVINVPIIKESKVKSMSSAQRLELFNTLNNLGVFDSSANAEREVREIVASGGTPSRALLSRAYSVNQFKNAIVRDGYIPYGKIKNNL